MTHRDACCVPVCIDGEGTHKGLHGFPSPKKDRQRFNTWLYAIGGAILALDNQHIYNNRRVCRSHFEERYLCRNNRLSNIAVPTLNIQTFLPEKVDKLFFKMPLQEHTLANLPMPSTSIDIKSSAYVVHTLPTIVKDDLLLENIDPDTVMNEPPPQPPMLKNRQEQALRKKASGKRIHLSNTERQMYTKIRAAKIKICKLKNKKSRLRILKLLENLLPTLVC